MVHLGECLIVDRAREIIGTVDSMMINKEAVALQATIVVIQELAFRLEKRRALFAWNVGWSR